MGGLLTIRNTNLPDCVVWNPWESGAKDMADLPDDSWRQFVCVENVCEENGQTSQIALAKGDSWSASVRYEAEDLGSPDARL